MVTRLCPALRQLSSAQTHAISLQIALRPPADESSGTDTASLFRDDASSPHERRILVLVKADEATHIDELGEKLEPELSSSEIFAALFELN